MRLVFHRIDSKSSIVLVRNLECFFPDLIYVYIGLAPDYLYPLLPEMFSSVPSAITQTFFELQTPEVRVDCPDEL